MLETIKHFFNMHGYGTYIWSAYSIAFVMLSWQWLQSWRAFKKIRNE
jgi:heme exporter protein CcmD